MRKLILLGCLFVSAPVYAQRFGSIRSGDDVSLSSNTILNQNTLQSGATFFVSSGTVTNNITLGSATISGWSFYGVTDDYMRIGPKSSGISLRLDRTEGEINIGNAGSASSVILKSQNSNGSGTISYTGATNGYSINSPVGLASGKELRLNDSIDSHYVALKASAAVSLNNTYILPASSGTADQAVTTDGANNLRFQTVIVSTNGLQSGSTFYVSSGTAQLYLAVGEAGQRPTMIFNASNPLSNPALEIYDGLTSPAGSIRFKSSTGADEARLGYGSSAFSISVSSVTQAGVSALGRLSIAKQSGNITFQDNVSNTMATFTTSSSTLAGQVSVGSIKFPDGTVQVTSAVVSGANVILNQNTLQSGATFFVSSGTASTFNTTTANIGTLNATTINGSPWGSANLVAYLNGANVLTTNPSFIYFDAFSILYAPSILGTSYMGGAFGAPIVSFDADNSNFVGFISSSVLATDNLYTMPSSSGAVNQVWVLDGSNKFQNKYVNQIMKFNMVLNPEQAKVPGDSPCLVTNSVDATVPGILCDGSTDEYVTWSTILTPYTTTTMVADIYYTMVSTKSGSVVHNISVMCASSTYTPNLDTASFGPVNSSTVAVPGAIGRMGVARVTLSSMDTGCNAGSMFIVKYNRDANAAADTATGNIYVRRIWLYEP